MDDLSEIRNRLDGLEAGLREVRAMMAEQGRPVVTAAAGPATSAWARFMKRFAYPAPPASPSPMQPHAGVPSRGASPAAPASPASPAAARSKNFGAGGLEASILGNWFARIGASAILLGAAFAFKYSVDRGLINPPGRIGLGVLAGLALLCWGEWARKRPWSSFAQAVSAGGVALMYLSIWAGYQLYDLWSGKLALLLLVAVVAAGALTALRHDSQVLGIMATLGGFINPLLVDTGRGSALALDAYVLALDAAVLAPVLFKRWRTIAAVALVATWLTVLGAFIAYSVEGLTDYVSLGFASILFVLFGGASAYLAASRSNKEDAADIALFAVNSIAYLLLGILALSRGARPIFAFLLALVHAGVALRFRSRKQADQQLVGIPGTIAVALLTLSVGLQLEGPALSSVWAGEAVALALAGGHKSLSGLRTLGMAVFGLSVLTSLLSTDLGLAYSPQTPLLSKDALPFLLQIATLTGAAVLLRRSAASRAEFTAAATAAVLANALAVLWLSFELRGFFDRRTQQVWFEAFAFALSTLWTVYALGLLAFGLGARVKWARLMSVALLGLVMIKLVLADVWLLQTPLRIAAFLGLGLVLLACSQTYHRFRELILGPDGSETLVATVPREAGQGLPRIP